MIDTGMYGALQLIASVLISRILVDVPLSPEEPSTSSLDLGTSVMNSRATNGGIWPLFTDGPVEYERQPIHIQDFMQITNHFRRIYI
jgi:hypothetical protein